jgi:hypothetical protein
VASRLPRPYHFRAQIKSFQHVAAPFPGDSTSPSRPPFSAGGGHDQPRVRLPHLVASRRPRPYHFQPQIQSFQHVAAPFPTDSVLPSGSLAPRLPAETPRRNWTKPASGSTSLLAGISAIIRRIRCTPCPSTRAVRAAPSSLVGRSKNAEPAVRGRAAQGEATRGIHQGSGRLAAAGFFA